MRLKRTALIACGLSAVMTGCASGPAAPAALRFPTATTALASTTLFTSPDGGIYQNPDPLRLLMVVRQSAAPVMRQLGSGAGSWRSLQQFGDFTYVAIAVTNHGAAGSDPQLNSAQIASDFAPPGTESGALRHFYHPMFPLAILREQSTDVQCGMHLDPGHSSIVVLLYPPVGAAGTIVWGMYQTFALRVPFGGGVPPGAQAWHAAVCTPPQPQAPPP
ncbi:MAG TPA: hypothetical protein VF155_00065, partial [Candidatus Dormibacteraeota bacterium]